MCTVHATSNVKARPRIKPLPILLIFQRMSLLFFIDRPGHGQLFSRQWLSNRHLKRFSFASRMNAP